MNSFYPNLQKSRNYFEQSNILHRVKFVLLFVFAIANISKLSALNVFSVASGNWSSTSTWSNTSGGAPGAAAPVAGDDVFIESGFTVTLDVNSATTINSISISAGSSFGTTSNFTLNATTVNVSGIYINGSTGAITVTSFNVNNGGNYTHNINGGTIPTATWNAASTLNITGITTTSPAGLGQSFGHVTWNSASQTGVNLSCASLLNINGNLSILSTGSGSLLVASGAPLTMTIGGDFIFSGGIIRGTNGAAGNNLTINLSGSFSQTGGSFDFGSGLGITTLNVFGNFSQTGGTITESGTALTNNIQFTSGTTHTYTSGGTISNIINFNVASGNTLQMATPTTVVSSAGTFTLSSGATLGVTSVDGILNVGTALGNIQTTLGRVYSAGANYIYNGSANQSAGTGLTQNNAESITINNSGNTVSLSANTTHTGNLNIIAGTLNLNNFTHTAGSLSGVGTITNSIASTRLLTIGSDNTNTSFSGIIQNGSGTVSLTKTGTGTQVLSGTNTYTGVTTISAGALSVSSIGNGGVAGNLGQATNAAANWVMNGGTLLYTGATASTDRNFTLGAGSISTFNISANTLTISGASTATTGGYVKSGAGTLVMSGTNAYTGSTTINAGVLSVATIGNGGVSGNLGAAAIAAGNIVLGGGTLEYTGATAATNRGVTLTNATSSIIDITTNQLTISGAFAATSGALTKNGAGTLTLSGANAFTGGVTLNTGTLNVNNTNALGAVTSTFTINGGIIDNTTGAAITTISYPIQVNADFTFTGTRNLNFGTGTTSISGNRTITTSAQTLTFGGAITSPAASITKSGAGTLSFGVNGVSINNITVAVGALISTSGILTIANAFSNSGTFTHNSGSVTFTSAGSIGGSSTTTFNNLNLNGTTNVITNGVINGILNMNEGASLSAGGFTYGAAGTLAYNGTTGFTTTSGEFPAASGPFNLTINNTGNVNLHAVRSINGTLNLNGGVFVLSGNNFTVNNTVAAAITTSSSFGSTIMVRADGAGQLLRAIATAGLPITYLFPVGEATGSVEYSPVSLTFSANSIARNIGVRVVQSNHPQLNNLPVQSDFISRYWPISNSAAGTYSYTGAFTFGASDLTGNIANLRLNMYNGAAWTQDVTSSAAGLILSSGALTQATMPLGGTAEFTGRVNDGQTYTWNQPVTGVWGTAANWTPNRTTPSVNDILVFNSGANTIATAVPTQTVGKILVSNNTTINLQSAGVVNLTIGGGNGNDLVIATGSTLQINSANALTLSYINVCTVDISGTLSLTNAAAANTYNSTNSVTTVAGSLNNFGIVTSTSSNLIFNASANYRHNYTTAPGTIPTATWNVSSNCIIQGYTTGGGGNFLPLGLAQSFGNFTWNCASQSNSAQLAGNLTTVNGDFTLTSTGAGASQLRLASNTTQTINIGGNLNINGGELSLSLNNGGSTTVNIGGNFTQTAGVLEFTQGNASSLGKLNINGDFTFSAGTMQQSAAPATGGIAVIEFLGSSAQNVNSSGSYTDAIDVILNNSNGINLTGTLQINNGATFYRTLGAITGGTVNYNATGSTLEYGLPGSNTAGVEFPSSNGPANLTINTTGMISLSGSRSLPATGVLTELNGILSLGAFDLTLNNNAAAAIVNATPSITNMIAADGTGYLMRAIATVARNYVFYIGDLTGTTEYSPISLNFSANSTARIVGARVLDATSPNMNTPLAPIDFTSRAWYLSENGAGGTYTYKPTLRYLAADINGTENNFLVSSFFGGLWTPYPSTITSPSIVTTNNLTQANFALNGAELSARCPVKYWTGATSSDWYDGTNWTPNGVPVSTDNIDISFNIPNPCDVGSGSVTINNLTLNGTGTLNLAANTTIIINGNLTYVNTATGTFDCTSTFRIANTVFPQTVPPLNFGHLNIVGGVRILSPSGTIGICGNYTPTAGALTTTNSSVIFNGTAAQSILTNTTSFNNVTVSNTGGNVSSAFNVTMNGTVQIDAAARYEQTAGTLTFSATAVANVDGFLKGSNAAITNNGSLTFSGTGKYEHSRIGVNPGTIPTATWASGSTCHVMGASNGNQLLNCGQAFHHFIYDNAATANIRTNGLLTTINGDFTILNTGAAAQTFQVGLAAGNIITIKGNYTQSAGVLDLVSGGGTTSVRLEGNFTISGTGKIDKSGNTADFNFVKSTGIQTFICTATGINANAIDWNVGNGTTTNTLQLQNNFIMANNAALAVLNNATLDCGTNTVTTATTTNGNFNLNSGGTLIIGSPNGIRTSPTASGNIQTTNSRVFSTAANYIYRASAAQVTGNGLPATVNNLEFDNTSGANPAIVQTASTTVGGTLSVTNGIVQLGTNNITLTGNLGSNLTGGSSTAFIQTNSTGELRRTIATSGFPQVYLYPIGTSTNYTPANYTFTSNSISRTLNVRTVAATHPQINTPNPQVDFISNRYWKTDLSSSAGTYVYTSQFTFLPGDINGTVTNINLNRFDNTTLTWTEDAGSSTSGTTISSGILTHITGPLTVTATTVAADWVGRIINGTYIWNGSVSSVYTNGNNWTPAIVGGPLSTDNIVINVPGTNQLNITGNITVYNLTLNATGVLNLAAGSTFTVNGNLTYAGTTTTNFDCSSTFNLTKITSQPVPPINYGNLNLTGGPRVLSGTGTIKICGNYTPSTSGTTVTGSTVEFNGTSAQSILISAADFDNFRVSNTSGTVSSLFNVNIMGTGTINANSSYSQNGGLFNIQASSTTNVRGNLIVNGGNINNSGTLNILNNGNFRIITTPSITGTAPVYATGAMLTYESSGTYNTGLEWSATSGAGYPHHVTLSNNTTLDLGNGAPATAKAISGNLLVNDGSQMSMNITPMTADLSVAGNVTIGTAGVATLVLSSLNGGNINVGGDWTRTATSVFTHNNRKVTFNRSTAGNQSINYAGTETFYDVDFAVSAGNATMNTNVVILNTMSLTSGKVNLNNNTLTLGTVANDGTLIGGSATEYIISGNTSSNWVRYTTANSTTYQWPIGDALHYTPIQVTFAASATLAANTQLSVHVVNTPHPNLGTSTNYLKRYWNVTPSNVPINTLYSVQYTWVAGDVVGVEANLFPFKHDSGGWIAAYGSGALYMMGSGSVNPGTHTTNWTTLYSFSDFTANGNGSPLPISLLTFEAAPIIDHVAINWSTLTETNNDFFTLERSIDANNFESIAKIAGAGNSNDFKEYSYTDTKPLNGTSYYRLKQTDFDGKFTYSEIEAVNFSSSALQNGLNITPNPSSNEGFSVLTNQLWEDNLVINLFDISGKLLQHYTVSDLNQQNRIFISTIELESGVYLLNVINGNNQYNEKVIVRK